MTGKRTDSEHPGASAKEFGRYFLASLIALAIDLGVFSISLRIAGWPWMWAAALGFCFGAVISYWLSIRFVFQNRTLRNSPAMEFAGFATIGIAGLGMTEIVLWLAIEMLDVLPEAGKLGAAVATFLFNYVLRKLLLFGQGRFHPRESSA